MSRLLGFLKTKNPFKIMKVVRGYWDLSYYHNNFEKV